MSLQLSYRMILTSPSTPSSTAHAHALLLQGAVEADSSCPSEKAGFHNLFLDRQCVKSSGQREPKSCNKTVTVGFARSALHRV